jgi:hypothetical protein
MISERNTANNDVARFSLENKHCQNLETESSLGARYLRDGWE